MNPHIKDVDKIYPGQNIVIPLKHIAPQEKDVPEEVGPRYVTIPMIPDVLFDYHKVQSGDYLSQIVTRQLGVAWHEIPDAYFKTFRRLNPQVEDLDLIYPGQLVRIPELMTAHRSPEPAVPEPTATATIRTAAGELKVADEEQLSQAGAASMPTPESSADDQLEPGTEPGGTEVGKSQEELSDVNETALGTPKERKGHKVLRAAKQKMAPAVPPPAIRSTEKPQWLRLVSKIAQQMGGRLLASGYCYFPGEDGEDTPLDLSVFPVLELHDGRHVVFEAGVSLSQELVRTIRESWKNVVLIQEETDAEAEVILDRIFESLFENRIRQNLKVPVFDDGIQVILGGDWVFPLDRKRSTVYYAVTLVETAKEKTSDAVVGYLAKEGVRIVDVTDEGKTPAGGSSRSEKVSENPSILAEGNTGQEAFVSALTEAMGYYYEPQIPISFDYAGFQVETAANIVYGKTGTDVIVDFGTFYGDAATSIERGGVKVVSVGFDDAFTGIAKDLFDALGCSYTESPELLAANRGLDRSTSLVLPGLLVLPAGGKKGLLIDKDLAREIVHFLGEKEITVWQIKR
jgi:hypothetical protein